MDDTSKAIPPAHSYTIKAGRNVRLDFYFKRNGPTRRAEIMDESLRQRLQNDLKQAMRDGDERRKTVVRLLMSSIRNAEVDARTDGRNGVVSEDDMQAIVRREVKQHEESVEEARNAGRMDLVAEQTAELELLRSYLPQQLSREQVVDLAKQTIAEVKASSPKQQGEVMKILVPKLKGQADGKMVSEVVRELLK
jgi:uncharacterized protein YqeY